MLAVVLIYNCFIRPGELRKLRCGHIDIREGVIRMPGSITKNGDDSVVTIPDIILPFVKSFETFKHPNSYYVFGRGLKIHPHQPCGHNTMNYRHAKLLNGLVSEGQLKDIKGLTLYSWKDTGDQDMARTKEVDVLTLRDHNRHKSLETTQKYMLTLPGRMEEVAKLKMTILPEDWEG